ncbi:MAG: type I restriction enzyme S subunit [Psychroserpens sp.]|jgi:type I restriction enzyme S subunit
MSTALTHIETEKLFVPALRFKQFEDKLINLGFSDVGKILIGLTHKPDYIKTGRPFLSSKNISKRYIDFEDIKYISEEEFQSMPSSTKPKRGDILFTRVGSNLGNPIILEKDIEFGIFVSLGVFRVNKKASNYFMKNWMDSNYFWRQLEQKVAGGAKNNLNTGWLKEFKLNLPTLPEQQKIASFLSAVDEKKQQLTKKKALLEQYKKGVMQQLFSGQLRFKDENGKDYPDWEEEFFKDIVIEYRLGGNYTNTEEETIYPLIKMGNLGRGKIQLKKLEYIPIDEEIDSKDKIEYGDLFFNTRNTLDLVGKVSIWRNELPEAYYNSNLMYLKFEDNFFMNYRLNSYEGLKGLKRFATGTTSVAAIYTKDLLKLPLNMPCLEEQQKIATYLSRIDTKIEAVTHQITQTQTFKKGLLQQMFV